MTERLFTRPTVFTANPDALTAWTIQDGWGSDEQAIILGGDIWRDNDGLTWRLRAHSPIYKDVEHDSSHLIDLEIAGLTMTGGYNSIGFEGYLVQGSWHNDPETLTAESMAEEHGKPWGRWGPPELCTHDSCESLPEHYIGAQYMAPERHFEPRKIRLDHGPVTWYALENEKDPTVWDRSTETLFWHEARDAAKADDRRIWTRTPNTNWTPQ